MSSLRAESLPFSFSSRSRSTSPSLTPENALKMLATDPWLWTTCYHSNQTRQITLIWFLCNQIGFLGICFFYFWSFFELTVSPSGESLPWCWVWFRLSLSLSFSPTHTSLTKRYWIRFPKSPHSLGPSHTSVSRSERAESSGLDGGGLGWNYSQRRGRMKISWVSTSFSFPSLSILTPSEPGKKELKGLR